MSEIISSKDIQPVSIQVASAEDAATLARIETGIRTAAQNVVQGYLTIGSYLNEAKGRKSCRMGNGRTGCCTTRD